MVVANGAAQPTLPQVQKLVVAFLICKEEYMTQQNKNARGMIETQDSTINTILYHS